MDPRGDTLGDATVCTAEATTSLPDHSPSPAERACHAICELHKLRFKLFGTKYIDSLHAVIWSSTLTNSKPFPQISRDKCKSINRC